MTRQTRQQQAQVDGGEKASAPRGRGKRLLAADVLALQRSHGNYAVQTRLMVGPVDDPYEREADVVAEAVVAAPATAAVQREGAPAGAPEEEELQMKPLAVGITPLAQREAVPEEDDEVQRKTADDEELQAKRTGDAGFEASADVEQRLSASRGGGSALPEATRAEMESNFGADFGGVRLHTNGEAAQLNRDLSARAFTHGSDVYFGEGEFAPTGSEGKRLLAHELTHVVQQGSVSEVRRDEKSDSNSSKPRVMTGYVGFNPEADRESEQLKKQIKTENSYSSLDNNKSEIELSSDAGIQSFVKTLLGDKANSSQLRAANECLKQCAPKYRDQMAELMKWFAASEKGQADLTRLVISGHHHVKWMWGAGDSPDTLEKINELLKLAIAYWQNRDQKLRQEAIALKTKIDQESFNLIDNLRRLANVFPVAALKVDDVMLSACNSQIEGVALKTIFPNLRSSWAYDGYSPTVDQGAADHIKQWEKSTRSTDVPKKNPVGSSRVTTYDIRKKNKDSQQKNDFLNTESVHLNHQAADLQRQSRQRREPSPRLTPEQKDQKLADDIRSNSPEGLTVIFSIPDAYASVEEITQLETGTADVSTYSFKNHLEKFLDEHQDIAQTRWSTYRQGKNERQRTQLSEKYSDATTRQKSEFLASMKDELKEKTESLRTSMWNDPVTQRAIANTEYLNNKSFDAGADNFASVSSAVALDDDGSLRLGKANIYQSPDEIGSKVKTIHENVLGWLGQHPSQSSSEESDRKIALVKNLAIAAHGGPNYLGGHGNAEQSSIGGGKRQAESKVLTIVSSMSEFLTPDIHVRLFACHTAAGNADASEDTIADDFRDSLVQTGHEDAKVFGHTESGDAFRNPHLRILSGRQNSQDLSRLIFTDEYVIGEIRRLHLADLQESVADQMVLNVRRVLLRKALPLMRNFSRDCWRWDQSRFDTEILGFRTNWSQSYMPNRSEQRSLNEAVGHPNAVAPRATRSRQTRRGTLTPQPTQVQAPQRIHRQEDGPQSYAAAEPGRELIDRQLRQQNLITEQGMLREAANLRKSGDLRWFFAFSHAKITQLINQNLSSFQRPNAMLLFNLHFAEAFLSALFNEKAEDWQRAFRFCKTLERNAQGNPFLWGEAEFCGSKMASVHINVDITNALNEVGCIPPADFGNMLSFVNQGSWAALNELHSPIGAAWKLLLQKVVAEPFFKLNVESWRNSAYQAVCNTDVPEPQ